MRVELARDIRVEERREGGIVADQAQDQVAGDQVAEGLLRRDEVLAGGAVDDGSRVEAVLRAEHRLQAFAVAALHGSLDDDVQALGGAGLPNDRLAGAKIADVERRRDRVDLLLRQAIEGRIGRVEALHRSSARSTGRP
jgi:hypothetical protein